MKKVNFWYITYEIIWITTVALLANFFFELKLDFHQKFELSKIIRFILLLLSIGFYGIYFFSFKKIYDKAKENDIKNTLDYEAHRTSEPKTIDDYFSENRKGTKKIWALVCSIIFLISFTYQWDSLF
jgi:hypothetical protein